MSVQQRHSWQHRGRAGRDLTPVSLPVLSVGRDPVNPKPRRSWLVMLLVVRYTLRRTTLWA